MDPSSFAAELLRHGVRFCAGVPDSYLHGFCSLLSRGGTGIVDATAANEGNAVAMAAGHYLSTGSLPLVYMQNSGLGNAVNPLASLTNGEMLSIPMLLLIGWRGDPFHADHVQHALQGRITPDLLEDLDIPVLILQDDESRLPALLDEACRLALEGSSPVAILSPKGVLSGVKSPYASASSLLTREEAMSIVLEAIPGDAVLAATTGRAARELYHLREAQGACHERDYLNVGSMGHASSVALGLAMGAPDAVVVCLDGDGACIMHMGAMAVIGSSGISNLFHVVLNNGCHESVGGVPSAARSIDLTGVAASCGYATVGHAVQDAQEVREATEALISVEGPAFLEVVVRPGIRSDLPPLEVDPKAMRSGLMQALKMDSHEKSEWDGTGVEKEDQNELDR